MLNSITTADFAWLSTNSELLQHLQRGLERETLRITHQGKLAQTPHPTSLGAALTHRWITTDFAEALLEFTTPVYTNVDALLQCLQDLHSHSLRQMPQEYFWPFSMPDLPDPQQPIALANYGNSLLGQFKQRYRQGSQQRYGANIQCIAGVHYNFSLPLAFWSRTASEEQKVRNDGYCRLMRNYYRLGWIIPYLFGASPIISHRFLQTCETALPFIPITQELWKLPYATSLRLSSIGYHNWQLPFYPPFNHLSGYLQGLQQLLQTVWPAQCQPRYGESDGGQQLNNRLLQTESELYFPIRPKALGRTGERPWQALQNVGITYVEIRALDINPFSAVGVTADQLRFLDLFLVWCALADHRLMTTTEFIQCQQNWQRICIAGLQPEQTVTLNGQVHRLLDVSTMLLRELQHLAPLFDQHNTDNPYQTLCQQLAITLMDPKCTLAAQLSILIEREQADSLVNLALPLAQHHHSLIRQPLQQITEQALAAEQQRSLAEQQALENSNRITFEQYLAKKLAF
ncbi:MAG: glutamate--cysteine ligase [Candidatus Symbiodolus clandestinus]